MQAFNDDELRALHELHDRGDSRFCYVMLIRRHGEIAHHLKEPFSLLAKDIPPPALPQALDRLAKERALRHFFLSLLLDRDLAFFKLTPEKLFTREIHLDGRSMSVTPDFLCRILYWLTRFNLDEEPIPQEWADRIRTYLLARWPSYDGRRVTQNVITDWMVAQADLDRADMPILDRCWFDLKSRLSIVRGLVGYALLLRRAGRR